jgi:hypothetical protein
MLTGGAPLSGSLCLQVEYVQEREAPQERAVRRRRRSGEGGGGGGGGSGGASDVLISKLLDTGRGSKRARTRPKAESDLHTLGFR